MFKVVSYRRIDNHINTQGQVIMNNEFNFGCAYGISLLFYGATECLQQPNEFSFR